jgi:intraflagellar transport protein 140
VSNALDLCLKTEQFSALQMVAEDLTENTDPEIFTRCSQFFMEHGQYDWAVELGGGGGGGGGGGRYGFCSDS